MLSKFSRFLMLLALGSACSASAQNSLSVHGSVLDSTGAAVPGAVIRLQTSKGEPIAETQADQDGTFTLLRLSAGDFSLVIPPNSGFAARMFPIHLTVPVMGLRITLSLDSVTQEVTVGNEQELSTGSSANRDTISVSGESLRKLPILDQDPIATLTPFLDASSGSSGGVTLIVDGIEMKSLGVSASAIQEVRINNDPFAAEFIRPGRGRIEIITKPGSPQFHGEVNVIFRDSVFNAKNHFALTRPPETRRIYEGHLTGPIGTGEHTSFAASASRREQDTAAIVSAVGLTGPINENVPTPNRNSQASIRAAHDFSGNHRFSIGYNFQQSSSTNAGVGGIILAEAGYDLASREDDAICAARGLAVDSARTARGRLRYSVVVCVFMAALLER